MTTELTTLRRQLDLSAARHTALVEQRASTVERLAQREADVRAVDVGLYAVRALREASTERVQQRLTDLTTEALRVVFDDPTVALTVNTLERRGVIEADLVLTRGELATDPLEGNGGGLVATVAAVLRLVMVTMLRRRGLAQLLILDEPLAALSVGYRAAMAETLESIAASLGVQVIVVTHSEQEMRGTVYRAQWKDREAKHAEIVREDAS